MIKFEFTVSDEDAENIFNCIHSHICDMRAKRIQFIQDDYGAEAKWMEGHIAYLETLMPQMLNTRVDSQSTTDTMRVCLESLMHDTGLVTLMRPDQVRRIEAVLGLDS